MATIGADKALSLLSRSVALYMYAQGYIWLIYRSAMGLGKTFVGLGCSKQKASRGLESRQEKQMIIRYTILRQSPCIVQGVTSVFIQSGDSMIF